MSSINISTDLKRNLYSALTEGTILSYIILRITISMIKEKHPHWPRLTKVLRDSEFDKILSTAPVISFSNNTFTLLERFKIIKKFDITLKNKLKSYIDMSHLNHTYITNGITESINCWINNIRTIGVLPNEYTYCERIAHTRNISLVDPYKDLDKCDKVIISCPFSHDGNTIIQQDLIYKCAEKDIPILIDMAYLGLTKPFTLDISRNNRVQIAYTMSKHFALPFDRLGILWSSHEDSELSILNNVGYVNITAIQRAQLLINNFDLDYIYKKYKTQSDQIIQQLGLTPTECVLFGHQDNLKFCITEYLYFK